MLAASLNASAQKQKAKAEVAVPAFAASDSAQLATQEAKLSVDSAITSQDSMNLAKLNTSLQPVQKKKRDWTTWKPEAKRAMWLALVLPGAGQIYNRKYWKLPIIYGGFVGCAYAITWNNQMYHDYSQAYLDIMDDDPNTQSYNQFLHLGATIDASNIERYKEIFRKRHLRRPQPQSGTSCAQQRTLCQPAAFGNPGSAMLAYILKKSNARLHSKRECIPGLHPPYSKNIRFKII